MADCILSVRTINFEGLRLSMLRKLTMYTRAPRRAENSGKIGQEHEDRVHTQPAFFLVPCGPIGLNSRSRGEKVSELF
jgi:hypothetical protein